MVSRKLLVIPCFNEELRWNQEYWNMLASLPYLHMLFVNDGSSDKTAELIKILCNNYHSVKSLTLKSNSGKAEAIRQGFQYSLSVVNENISWYGFLDADGCIPFDEVSRILEITDIICSPNTDALWTSRVRLSGHNIERKAARHIVGRLIAGVVSLGRPGLPKDTQCGFKLFRSGPNCVRIFQEPFQTKNSMNTLKNYAE
jgi:glycosyltransferase involved in cell wall biosynthesis